MELAFLFYLLFVLDANISLLLYNKKKSDSPKRNDMNDLLSNLRFLRIRNNFLPSAFHISVHFVFNLKKKSQ